MDLDNLVQTKLVSLRSKIIDTLAEKHPHIVSMAESIVTKIGGEKRFGLQVVDEGSVLGDYTLIFTGLRIDRVETNSLTPSIKHLFIGEIKPYVIIEKNALENIVNSEEKIINDPFKAVNEFLPNITLKFM